MNDKEIVIKPKFDFNIIMNATMHLIISKSTLIIYSLICLFIVSGFVLSIFLPQNEIIKEVNLLRKPFPYIILIFGLLFYLSIRIASKKSLKNHLFSQDIKFIFNGSFFQEKGETFDIKHHWDKVLKIKEREDYFLIYHSKIRANIIPKQSFNKQQQSDFRNLINDLKVKSKIYN